MPNPQEHKPNAVPGPDRTWTKPDGAVRARWPWTKPWGWPQRILTALEHGVKGDQRWSLAFFAERGLFTLEAALACQSFRR